MCYCFRAREIIPIPHNPVYDDTKTFSPLFEVQHIERLHLFDYERTNSHNNLFIDPLHWPEEENPCGPDTPPRPTYCRVVAQLAVIVNPNVTKKAGSRDREETSLGHRWFGPLFRVSGSRIRLSASSLYFVQRKLMRVRNLLPLYGSLTMYCTST